ncbi:hypothetical protein CEP52_003812 [Fusarium oligoseptatum]|uniref:Uncharacterized protein n=1 Tax=Fusarium oligoseptatum TaxID=2604345 RepID=A0A428U6X3_9HYPO|nr:hypothetical protein CEP52_003812 [Fusarium oligoseptatum]
MESIERLFQLFPNDQITTQVTTATRVLIKGIIEDAERTKKEAEQVKAEYQRRLDRLDPDSGTFQSQLNTMQSTVEEALMAELEQVADTNADVQSQIQERQAFERQAQEPIKNLEREVDRLESELQVSQQEGDEALLQVKCLEQPQSREERSRTAERSLRDVLLVCAAVPEPAHRPDRANAGPWCREKSCPAADVSWSHAKHQEASG